MATSNPGPAIAITPDPQASIGNIQKNALLFTPTITPVAVAAATTAQQTFSALGLGLQLGDQISTASLPSFVAGIFIVGASVTAADTMTVTFGNVTAGSVTPPAGAYQLEVNRPQALTAVPAGYMNAF